MPYASRMAGEPGDGLAALPWRGEFFAWIGTALPLPTSPACGGGAFSRPVYGEGRGGERHVPEPPRDRGSAARLERGWRSFPLAGFLWACLACPVQAADFQARPEDYRAYLSRLAPGDRLLLRGGDYGRGLPLQNLEGRADAPIVIEGPRDGPGARFIARPGANTVSLANVRHVILRHLELDGRNLPVDAVKAEGHARYAHHVTLENLHIHDHAASQQSVGISSKCPAFGWVVRGNRIERVGTGMYFGDSDGSDPFVAGLIENNHVSDTLGYSLQIKHQKSRPADLPEAEARHDTIIRRNVFAKESRTPTPPGGQTNARPNVLVGHFPVAGPGSEDRYLIHANLFWQNPGEALFQGEGNLALYNNVFVNRHGPAVRIQPHNDIPRQVEVFHNTVLARGEGVALRQREGAPEFSQRVVGNIVFAARPLLGGEQGDNVTGGLDAAERHLAKPHAELAGLDLSPRARLPKMAGRPPQAGAMHPDSQVDIDGRPRATPFPGACAPDGPSPCPRPIAGGSGAINAQ